MSVQFGRWNFDGQSVDPEYIAKVRTFLAPYAPDSTTVCVKGAFFLLYGALHTTEESRHERQPSISPAGTYLMWDGRLDNRSELAGTTNRHPGSSKTDLDIVSESYESQGTKIFGELLGDWSLSVLHHYERTLVLAVDFLGTRPLYYFHCDRYVAWSSVLEPLVVLADRSFSLCEEYLAGWLHGFPTTSLTPYREILAVPPGSFVEITRNATKIRKHWDFHPGNRVPFSSYGEYEEGFRYFFAQAVRRRLRSNGPVISELSGGMDSSSIVCVADRVLEDDPTLTPRLETLSYLDDAEPDWNERPFIAAVETTRGRPGFHVDVNKPLSFIPERDPCGFPGTPASSILPSLPQQQVSSYLGEAHIRVVLSGFGGDETTGGVPDGTAELADLLIQGRWTTFFRQAVAWCLPTRRPLIQLVGGVLSEFLPRSSFRTSLLQNPVPWITKEFVRTANKNPAYAPLRLKFNGLRPSIQENLYTLEDLRRQIACAGLPFSPLRERRYPFLDRNFLEFLYNLPREQIVRPGRRRSLMRRALKGVVPEEILERKRKAYVSRRPIVSLRAHAAEITEWTKNMLCAECGAIDLKVFHEALAVAYQGDGSRLWQLSRTLDLESWLRDERVREFVRLPNASPRAQTQGSSNVRHLVFGMKSSQLGNLDQKGGGKT